MNKIYNDVCDDVQYNNAVFHTTYQLNLACHLHNIALLATQPTMALP